MRSTAHKVKIEDIVGGEYVRSPEGEPNYLITPWDQKILRINLIATVVDKFVRDDGGYATLSLDDGTETIRAKAWTEGVREMEEFEVGDLITVVGKVREYEGEIHLVPEVIRRVEDPNWELVRRLEILHQRKNLLAEGRYPEPKREIKAESGGGERIRALTSQAERVGTVEKLGETSERKIPDDLKDKLLLALAKLEGEDGATPTDLAAELDISKSDAEDVLGALLNEDKIYEPRAGRFKRLG